MSSANKTIHELQTKLVSQQCHSNSLVTSLRIQIRKSEEALHKQRMLNDRQLGEVLAHLVFLEGKLKREQAHVRLEVKNKDELIRKQKYEIEDLTLKNERLVHAVKEHYARNSKNGVSVDHPDKKYNENTVPPSPSPSVKHKKGAFNSVKEKLWKHHRSSFDLTEGQGSMYSNLKDGRQYSSQENLSTLGKKKRESRESRDKKCKSIAGYPDHSLDGLIPEEVEISTFDPPPHWLKQNSESEASNQTSPSTNGYHDHNPGHLDVSPGSMMSATSMPILSEQNAASPAKERPHSISSIESLSKKSAISSPTSKSATTSPVQQTATIDSNPFKNLKTILKRKGSKSKKQKRSVSMSQNTNHEHQETMKRHFEKYEMA